MIVFIGTSLQLQPITYSYITAHSQWLPKTHSIPYWATSVFSSAVTYLVLIYESLRTNEDSFATSNRTLSQSLMLRPTVSRPVCLGINTHLGLTTRFLVLSDSCGFADVGAFSLTRGRVCRLQLLLDLASAVILGLESRGTLDHILLSQIRDFPFRRLLRLAELRWRYSTPRSHGMRRTE
jgi:hypothetical protein